MTIVKLHTRMIAAFVTTVMAVSAVPWAEAATINVPTDYPTIQEGMDAAVSGDTVHVAPGVYEEALRFKDGITLEGESAETVTVQWPARNGSLLIIPEAEAGVIQDMTFTHSDTEGLDSEAKLFEAILIENVASEIRAPSIGALATCVDRIASLTGMKFCQRRARLHWQGVHATDIEIARHHVGGASKCRVYCCTVATAMDKRLVVCAIFP